MYRFLKFLIFVMIIGCANGNGISDFESDGCSLFPDRFLITEEDWCDCCFKHDMLYWQGGTEADRLNADEALRDCILQKTGNEYLAKIMYSGVRFGGSPYFYNWYRWGYGWNYDRKYNELSEEEKRQTPSLHKKDGKMVKRPVDIDTIACIASNGGINLL